MPVEIMLISVIAGILIVGVLVMIPVFKVLSSIAPYTYVNARLKAMKKKLVSDKELINLSFRPYADIINYLERTSYPNLALITKGDISFSSVDTALRRNLIEDIEKIRRLSPQQQKEFIDAILAKYDIQIIEHIVRGTTEKNRVKTDILHHTRLFSQSFVNKQDHSLEGLKSELKGTKYYDIIQKHIKEISKSSFENFEYELDLYYFSRLLSKSSHTEQKKYTKMVIDSHNISLAFKGKKPIVPGGYISPERIASPLTAQNAIKILREAGYRVASDTIQGIERDMQINIKEYGKALFSKDPHSSAIITGYIILKSINTRNVTILLKMAYHGYEATRIQEVIAA